MLVWLTLKEERRRKEKSENRDDLPVLATCWSSTFAILSSEVNGPVARGIAQ